MFRVKSFQPTIANLFCLIWIPNRFIRRCARYTDPRGLWVVTPTAEGHRFSLQGFQSFRWQRVFRLTPLHISRFIYSSHKLIFDWIVWLFDWLFLNQCSLLTAKERPAIKVGVPLGSHINIANNANVCQNSWEKTRIEFIDNLKQFFNSCVEWHTNGSLVLRHLRQ